jgi:hypothetical protein
MPVRTRAPFGEREKAPREPLVFSKCAAFSTAQTHTAHLVKIRHLRYLAKTTGFSFASASAHPMNADKSLALQGNRGAAAA